jgi:hypothetical protein
VPPPFRYRLRVRYGECDAQQVVFNARYGDYADAAMIEYQRVVWGATTGPGAVDMQLVRQVKEWHAPARFDDVLEVRVTTGGDRHDVVHDPLRVPPLASRRGGRDLRDGLRRDRRRRPQARAHRRRAGGADRRRPRRAVRLRGHRRAVTPA